MEIRIGVVNVAREIHIEVEDSESTTVVGAIEAACGGKEKVLWISDKSGRRVAIPTDKLAYVDIGSSDERRVGFAGN